MSATQKPVRIIRPNQPFSDWVKHLIERRETLFFFIWKELKVQYSRPIFGLAWSVFQPLVYFGIILSILRFSGRTGTISTLPFPVYLISGLAIWNFTTTSILGAMSSIHSNSGIITKSFFPRFYLILAPLIKATFDLFIVLMIVLMIAVYYGVSLSVQAAFFLPISLVIVWITTLGLASIVCAAVIFNRQIRHAIPVLLYAMIFLLPIFYSMETMGNRWLKISYQLNPIAGSMDCLRATLGGADPSFVSIVCWSLIALVLAFIGIISFRRIERSIADRI